MARVLGVCRLSRYTDASSSIERQEADILRWASAYDHEIVGWARDVDVSGGVDPFNRPELAWYLTPDGADGWDVLVVSKIDRLSRRVYDVVDLLRWAEANGKSVKSINEDFDLGTPIGRSLLILMASLAEGELESVKFRVKQARTKFRSEGRWSGGTPPYGTHAVKRDDHTWGLEHDPITAPVLRSIIARALRGEAPHAIAIDLNARNVPAQKGGGWFGGTVGNLLKSRGLLGEHMYPVRDKDGKVTATQLVTDHEGNAVVRYAPFVTETEWAELQDRLSDRSRTAYRRASDSLLLRVAYCSECGAALTRLTRGNLIYYRCTRVKGIAAPAAVCSQRSIRAEPLLTLVEKVVLSQVGPLEVMRRRIIPGDSPADELARLERTIRSLREDQLYYGDALTEEEHAESRQVLKGLLDRRNALRAAPTTGSRYQLVGTGQTYREMWATLEIDGRRQLLWDGGVKVYAGRGEHLLAAAKASAARTSSPMTVRFRPGQAADPMLADVDLLIIWTGFTGPAPLE